MNHSADADRQSEARVQRQLGKEKPAETLRGIVERRGGLLQIVRARKLDQAVSQILALHQREDHEDDHDARRHQRVQQG